MILVIVMSISSIIPMSCHQMIIKNGFHPPTKNGDYHELEDEYAPKDHHGVMDLTRSVAVEGDYQDEEN